MSRSIDNASAQATQKRKLTIFQSIITGSVAGATEVMIDHPLWTIKTRSQRKIPFTLNPSVLYTGILPNAASMIPITAIQVGLDRAIKNVFFSSQDKISPFQRITAAFIAGIGSSIVSCPTEMVMTHQGKGVNKKSFKTTYNDLVNTAGHKCLFNALPATAAREGLFTTFFLAGIPMVKEKISPYFKNDNVATIASGMIAGVGATLASQFADTIKTVQQDADLLQPIKLRTAAVEKIYQKDGVFGLFNGSVPRGARVVSAVTILGFATQKMEAYFGKN